MQCLHRFSMIYDGNDKSSGLPRGMSLVTRMAELQANMRGIQWYSRVQILPENAHRAVGHKETFPPPLSAHDAVVHIIVSASGLAKRAVIRAHN
jgi:hypothetical protein